MGALTQERDTARQETELLAFWVAADTTIYAGALVCLDATGMAVPGAEDATLTCAGRAEETVVNGGAAGDEVVVVRRKGAFKWENDATDPVTAAHLLQACYVVDDQTVSSSHETNTRCVAGAVVAVDADGVWVEIN